GDVATGGRGLGRPASLPDRRRGGLLHTRDGGEGSRRVYSPRRHAHAYHYNPHEREEGLICLEATPDGWLSGSWLWPSSPSASRRRPRPRRGLSVANPKSGSRAGSRPGPGRGPGTTARFWPSHAGGSRASTP